MSSIYLDSLLSLMICKHSREGISARGGGNIINFEVNNSGELAAC